MDDALYGTFFDVEDWYWWSVGTRAIFREWLAKAVGAVSARVLDVGCGTGALAQELAELGNVVGIDCAASALTFCRRRGLRDLCAAHAEMLPFRSAAFDAVAAVDIVEHTDDGPTVHEIARVLKPGGVALIHVPAFPLLWGEHDEVNHHRCRYRRAQLTALIAASGLTVERLSYVNCLLFPAALSVRLSKRVVRGLGPRGAPQPEIYDLPMSINRALTSLLLVERAMLRHINFPFGVSLLCLARKPDDAV